MISLNRSESLAFLDGHQLPLGGVCVIAALWGAEDTDDRMTRLVFVGRGAPVTIDVPGNVVDIACTLQNDAEIVVGLLRGDESVVIRLADEMMTREKIHPSRPVWLGGLTGLHVVGDAVIAYGMYGQVYVRRACDGWQPFDDGLFEPKPSVDAPFICAIVGNSLDELYAVGCGGLLARCNGRAWSMLDCPTNVNLNQAVKSAAGEIWACGDCGVLLCGAGDEWRAIDSGVGDGFWGIAALGERIFLATLEGLWTVNDQQEAVAAVTSIEPSPTSYRLASDSDSVWSFGLCDVLRFDGAAWERILSSEGDAGCW